MPLEEEAHSEGTGAGKRSLGQNNWVKGWGLWQEETED